MKKTDRNQQLLNWLENEKVKDSLELKKSKQDIINQIKGIRKEDLFEKKEKKVSLWQKIKIMIWGK